MGTDRQTCAGTIDETTASSPDRGDWTGQVVWLLLGGGMDEASRRAVAASACGAFEIRPTATNASSQPSSDSAEKASKAWATSMPMKRIARRRARPM